MNEKYKFGLEWVENMVGKRENAGYQSFHRFPHCFQKPSGSGSLKVRIVWLRVKKLLFCIELTLSVECKHSVTYAVTA